MRCFSVAPSRNSIAMNVCPVLLTDVVYRADVWVIQRRRRLGFSLEAGQGLRVSGYIIGQKLERNETVETSILSFVDNAHPAAAELLNYAVMRDGLADHKGAVLLWSAMLGAHKTRVNGSRRQADDIV